MEQCCREMTSGLASSAIVYRDDVRRFELETKAHPQFPLTVGFCPFCGFKLPRPLVEEWNAAITDLGLLGEVVKNKAEANIPAEMKTGEWWRKRGL